MAEAISSQHRRDVQVSADARHFGVLRQRRRSLRSGGSRRRRSGRTTALPPVEQWNPPFCGDIDMRIARDGTWFYGGTPIGRPALVRLFSTILRKDPEGYVLVTPVEKVGIKVEDAPFLAVEMTVARRQPEQAFAFFDQCRGLGRSRPAIRIRFEKSAPGGIKPYIHMRGDLWALVTRAVFLDLVGLGEIREHEGERAVSAWLRRAFSFRWPGPGGRSRFEKNRPMTHRKPRKTHPLRCALCARQCLCASAGAPRR